VKGSRFDIWRRSALDLALNSSSAALSNGGGGVVGPGDGNGDLRKEFLQTGWRAKAQQPSRLSRGVVQLRRRLGWNVKGLTAFTPCFSPRNVASRCVPMS
jgi:hypothetical protein